MTTTDLPTRPRRLGRWALAIVALLIVALAAVLGPRVYHAFSLLRAGDKVDVGGYELFIHCEGTGSPTVVLEHGLGSNGHEWQTVQGVVAESTRVCWASRAGMGFSDRAPGSATRTAQDSVDDLTQLLTNASIDGPYVVVGHSFGGYIVRLFATQHPDEVVGVVLVDSTHERQLDLLRDRISPEAWDELSAFFGSDNPEHIDFASSAEQVDHAPDLGAIPLIVLEATEQSTSADDAGISRESADEVDAAMADLWPALQADLASLSTRGIHRTVPGSGHFIQNDQPDAVIDAVREVLAQLKTEAD